MFLGIVTAAAGIYVLLIAAGLLHRGMLKPGGDAARRMGMSLFGLGLLIVGLYAIHHSYTLHANRNNPNFRPADRFGRPSAPLFPPRSRPQNPR